MRHWFEEHFSGEWFIIARIGRVVMRLFCSAHGAMNPKSHRSFWHAFFGVVCG